MNDNLDELYRLLLVREQQYYNATIELWDHIKFVSEGIAKYLGESVENISWSSVDVIGPEMVVMVSARNRDRHQYTPPGTLAARVLTIVIPISVIESNDADLITEYLRDTVDIRASDSVPEAGKGGVVAYMNTTRKILH